MLKETTLIFGFVVFMIGLGLIWAGIRRLAMSPRQSLFFLGSGLTLSVMSVISVNNIDPEQWVNYLVWPAAIFWCLALVFYGPLSSMNVIWRILIFGFLADFEALYLYTAFTMGRKNGMFFLLFGFLVWAVLLASYAPKSRTAARLRKMALIATAALAVVASVAGNTAYAFMKNGDFWVVDLPFGYTVIPPHPYDYYAGKTIPVLFLASFVLAVASSLACLLKWRIDTHKGNNHVVQPQVLS